MLMPQDEGTELRRTVEAAIDAAHVGRKYMNLSPAVVDQHLPEGQLLVLLNDLVIPQETVVEVEDGLPEYERCHRFRIGLRAAPLWSELLDGSATKGSDHLAIDELHYSDVAVSRLGPFWHGSWRKVRFVDGKAVGETCAAPNQEPWARISEHTRETMRRFALVEIDHQTAQIRVPWLDTTGAWFLNAPGRGPTVYECLISPFY